MIRSLSIRTVFSAVLALLLGLNGGCGRSLPAFAGTFRHAAVAADHEVASAAGLEVLRKGGNAVDAAVATSFALSVVRPESCGIGGGGFMVIHFSSDGVQDQKRRGRQVPSQIALNYREMCPNAVGPEFYERDPDPSASVRGGKAAAIPGTVAGLLTALDRYGTLDRATVLAPAIRAAESGFRADAHFVNAAATVKATMDKSPGMRERFHFLWVRYCKEGRVRIGDLIQVPEQARALRLIADQGTAAFYQGAIAQAMVEAIARDRGVLTHDDLGHFQVASVEPLTYTAFGRRFITMPPPSSGGIAMAEALGILERIHRKRNPGWSPAAASNRAESGDHAFSAAIVTDLADYQHPIIESFKHAYADRAEWLSDPAFNEVPAATLLSETYLTQRASLFDPDRTLPQERYGSRREPREDHGTSHFCVIDAMGNAVACTETINLEFGSYLAVDTFGFLLNNEMDDFTTRRGKPNAFGLRQSDANLPQPGKRPLSSMSPTIIFDAKGRVDVIAGASGGPRIISGTMQAVLNTIDFELPAWEAVEMPRLHHQWSPDIVRMEAAWFDSLEQFKREHPGSLTLIDDLQARGHRVERYSDDVGNVQMIARDPSGRWQAACDPRKGGKPAGY